MSELIERRFWLAISLVLLVVVALAAGSAWQESQTYDEGFHLSAGYRYVRTGRFTMNPEHPPFQNSWNAAPLLFLDSPLPTDEDKTNQYGMARRFLYSGPIHADKILFMARMMSVSILCLLVLAVAGLTRRLFGSEAGLLASIMTGLDPNLLAHGHYVTTDISCAAFFYLTGTLWLLYLESSSNRIAAAAALAAGLGLASKFSMVLMMPILAIMTLVHLSFGGWTFRRAEKQFATLVAVYVGALSVVLLVYLPDSWNLWRSGGVEDVPTALLPIYRYFEGVMVPFFHQKFGHESYLLGETGTEGWWYYFPVVIAVKSTTALLLAMVTGVAIAIWKAPKLLKARAESAKWLALMAPPAIYFAIVLTSRINIGARHVLPVFAYLCVLSAAAIWRSLPRRTAVALSIGLVGLQAAESISAYPGFIAFFNLPSGGSETGPYYLRDSNVDWGQDLKKLKEYVDREKPERLCLDYFGIPDPKYYGISFVAIPMTWESKARQDVDCIAALSVTAQANLYRIPESYDWLKGMKPMGMVGKSIYLYDLRKSKGSRALHP